ncbi:MAG TPA: 50S ribosomal protein L15 [Candidatus Babeliales bacterium]|nr:50S ribosomal protein L15 [Candidatus Babeliales bacterium]
MKYNELVISRQKKPLRIGRGISAGRGKTAGRGTKGQGARKSPLKSGFEGGQLPLYMRLPKLRGFKSHRRQVQQVYTGQIDKIKKASIDTNAVYEAGLINNPYVKVKLLYKGEISSKKEVKLQLASKKAIEMVEKAGGSFQSVGQLPRPAKKLEK